MKAFEPAAALAEVEISSSLCGSEYPVVTDPDYIATLVKADDLYAIELTTGLAELASRILVSEVRKLFAEMLELAESELEASIKSTTEVLDAEG